MEDLCEQLKLMDTKLVVLQEDHSSKIERLKKDFEAFKSVQKEHSKRAKSTEANLVAMQVRISKDISDI